MKIRFNYPYMTGHELDYVKHAMQEGRLAGGGPYTKKCHNCLEQYLGAGKVLLTHSCTAALEMAAILLDIEAGDEIIMPSYTFVSTANAFVLRGGVPVFVDIRPDTLNIDEDKIEQAITERTKAICVVHYAGVACEMDKILEIAARHGLFVIEDAAQALGSAYKGKQLGGIGDLAAISFHETKNIISGEGGALVINNSKFAERAEIVWEKGTDRSRFFRGEVDKYTWVDIGSSYLPSELVAAFLLAQLERIDSINAKRMELWNLYYELLQPVARETRLILPTVPEHCRQNAHMFYLLLADASLQEHLLDHMRAEGTGAVFHYIPLHLAKAGKKYCRTAGVLDVTEDLYSRLVRLPLWPGMDEQDVRVVCSQVTECLSGSA